MSVMSVMSARGLSMGDALSRFANLGDGGRTYFPAELRSSKSYTL